MTDYKKMYMTLCHAASNALDLLQTSNDTAQIYRLLQDALCAAEEIYLETCEDAE